MSHGSQDKIRASDNIRVSFEGIMARIKIIMILDAMDHILLPLNFKITRPLLSYKIEKLVKKSYLNFLKLKIR
jgi:hypothetical protein